MLTQEQKIILGKLDYYVAFLASALPARLTATFCELLVAVWSPLKGWLLSPGSRANSITSGGVTTSGSKRGMVR